MKLKRTAQKATPRLDTAEAWWYEGRNSIQVYVQDGDRILSCRIRRAALSDWIKRTEKTR